MSEQRKKLYGLLVVQLLALILYPPSFFANASQVIVLPPTMVILYVLALVALNIGALSPELGRSSLDFVQGINVVARLMMFFPNLNQGGSINGVFILLQIVAIGLSWYVMSENAKLRPHELLLAPKR